VVARLDLGYRTSVRRLALVLIACGHPAPAVHGVGDPGLETGSVLAPDEADPPPYSKAEVDKALVAERASVATAERALADLDASGDDAAAFARADLDVRRRFVAMLESCQAEGRACPPRLDDPPWTFDIAADVDPRLDAPLAFDLAGWRAIAAELHGRACACRTHACVDSLDVAITRLEPRPAREVRGDEPASASLTRARECLFRLRGRHVERRSAADAP